MECCDTAEMGDIGIVAQRSFSPNPDPFPTTQNTFRCHRLIDLRHSKQKNERKQKGSDEQTKNKKRATTPMVSVCVCVSCPVVSGDTAVHHTLKVLCSTAMTSL